jgi:hypothetical protein
MRKNFLDVLSWRHDKDRKEQRMTRRLRRRGLVFKVQRSAGWEGRVTLSPADPPTPHLISGVVVEKERRQYNARRSCPEPDNHGHLLSCFNNLINHYSPDPFPKASERTLLDENCDPS